MKQNKTAFETFLQLIVVLRSRTILLINLILFLKKVSCSIESTTVDDTWAQVERIEIGPPTLLTAQLGKWNKRKKKRNKKKGADNDIRVADKVGNKD